LLKRPEIVSVNHTGSPASSDESAESGQEANRGHVKHHL
ncbi:hypothetical protein T08_351, partial [Trichinella sp. T8]